MSYEERFNEAAFDVDCTKHGHSRSLSGDCGECLKEAYMESEANEGPRGLCGGCDNADYERSSAWQTWCMGWKKAGFPCRPRKKHCAKFTPRRMERWNPDDMQYSI